MNPNKNNKLVITDPNTLSLPETHQQIKPIYDILPAPEDQFAAPTLATRKFDAYLALMSNDSGTAMGSLEASRKRKNSSSRTSTPSKTKTKQETGGGLLGAILGAPRTTTETESAFDVTSYTHVDEQFSRRDAVTNVTNITPLHVEQVVQSFILAKNGVKDSHSLLMFADTSHVMRSTIMFTRLAQIATAAENIVRTAKHSDIETTMSTQYPLLLKSLIEGAGELAVNSLRWEDYLTNLHLNSDLNPHQEMLRRVNQHDLFASFDLLCMLAHQSEPALANLSNGQITTIFHQILKSSEPDLAITIMDRIRDYSRNVVDNSSSDLREENGATIRQRDAQLLSSTISKIAMEYPEKAMMLKDEYLKLVPEQSLVLLNESFPDLEISVWSQVIENYQKICSENQEGEDTYHITADSATFLCDILPEKIKQTLLNGKENIEEINSQLESWVDLITIYNNTLKGHGGLIKSYEKHVLDILPKLAKLDSSKLDLVPLVSAIKLPESLIKMHRLIMNLPFLPEIKQLITQTTHDQLGIPINPTEYYLKELMGIRWNRRESYNIEYPMAYLINHSLVQSSYLLEKQKALNDMSTKEWPYPKHLEEFVSPEEWKTTVARVMQFEKTFKEKYPINKISERTPLIPWSKRKHLELSNDNSKKEEFLKTASYTVLIWLLGYHIIEGRQPQEENIAKNLEILMKYYEKKSE